MAETARRHATYDDLLALPDHVVGEIVGRNPGLPPVLLACHIDS